MGTFFGGPHNKDYSILGSILGSRYCGKLPITLQNPRVYLSMYTRTITTNISVAVTTIIPFMTASSKIMTMKIIDTALTNTAFICVYRYGNFPK